MCTDLNVICCFSFFFLSFVGVVSALTMIWIESLFPLKSQIMITPPPCSTVYKNTKQYIRN